MVPSAAGALSFHSKDSRSDPSLLDGGTSHSHDIGMEGSCIVFAEFSDIHADPIPKQIPLKYQTLLVPAPDLVLCLCLST